MDKQLFGKDIGDSNEPPVNPAPQHLVWIKPGTFTMGSPTNDVDSVTDERPQTQVTISRGFWMGKHEVTQEQYQAVMGSNPSSFKGSRNLPVESVSWVDATNFCAKLTDRERQAGRLPPGYVYRLPTEAEWEYACRSGTMTRFSFGDDPHSIELEKYAWYSGNSGNQTQAVGAKAPNDWGLSDMHGNVWEWCQDWYGAYSGGSVTNPTGPSSGSARVIRGGSWIFDGWACRAAYRDSYSPDYRDYDIGFRPVLAPGQP